MGVLNRKVYKKNIIINFILLVFLFEPNILVKYPIYNNLFIVGGVISFLNIFIIYIKKHIKLNKMMLFFILFMALNILSTVINNGDVLKIGYVAMTTVALFLYAKYFYDNENIDEFINMLYKIFTLYLTINLVLYIFKPQGISDKFPGIYFLGIRTRFTEYVISCILLAYINYKNKIISKKKMSLSIAIALINIFIHNVTTAYIGIMCSIVFYYFLINFVRKNNYIKFNWLAIVIYVFIILIVFARVQIYFEFLIVDILGKDLTFTGRTYIWDSALQIIKKSNIIFGNGCPDNGNFVPYGGALYQAHNEFIQIIYESGLIGIWLFLLFINAILKSHKYDTSKIDIIIVSVVYALMVMMISEIYSYYIAAYIPMIIFFYRNKLSCNKGVSDENNSNCTNL